MNSVCMIQVHPTERGPRGALMRADSATYQVFTVFTVFTEESVAFSMRPRPTGPEERGLEHRQKETPYSLHNVIVT